MISCLIPSPRLTDLNLAPPTHVSREEASLSACIYVGNLPYSATGEQLAQLFTAYGDVSEVSIVVVDRATGQSKGFTFVQMESDEAAHDAIAGVNSTLFDGRTLRVSEAQARPERSGSRVDSRPRHDERSGGGRWQLEQSCRATPHDGDPVRQMQRVALSDVPSIGSLSSITLTTCGPNLTN
jgi:RNA recognition motif-containing protein